LGQGGRRAAANRQWRETLVIFDKPRTSVTEH
jgi:hypothetical protein